MIDVVLACGNRQIAGCVEYKLVAESDLGSWPESGFDAEDNRSATISHTVFTGATSCLMKRACVNPKHLLYTKLLHNYNKRYRSLSEYIRGNQFTVMLMFRSFC